MKNRLTIVYLVFGVVTIVIIGLILYLSLSSVIIKDSVTSANDNVEQSGKYIEVYLERLKSLSHIIADDTTIVEYFSSDVENMDYKIDQENQINALIDHVITADDTILSIVIISKDGKIFSNEDGLDMSMSEDMMREEWYVSAVNNDMPSLSSARMQNFSMDKDLWVISLSQEIINSDGENIGVVVLDIPYTVIEEFLMDLNLGHEGFSFILNENNGVVFHPDPSYYTETEKQGDLVEILDWGNTYDAVNNTLISQYKLSMSDWTLVCVSSMDTLLYVRRQLLETIVIGLIIVLLGVIITSVILRRLTMQITETEKRLHKYEMNVLYSQINPHFLYNTLDTIVWMAEFEQKEAVIDTTKSLAKFFRISLSGGNDLIQVSDELEHVEKYLFIQKQRYQEKLNYSFQINEDALDLYIPKIILQPIVENAIYHGIKDLDGEGHIKMQVELEGDIIQFMIIDNGVGLQEKKEQKAKLGGVGLANVDERVKIHSGLAGDKTGDYGVKLIANEDAGMTGIIRVLGKRM